MSEQLQQRFIRTHHKSHKFEVYHTDQDCPRLKDASTYRKATENDIEAYNLRECKECAGESSRQSEEETEPCLFCGKEIKRLATHLPKCEEKP